MRCKQQIKSYAGQPSKLAVGFRSHTANELGHPYEMLGLLSS